jgi:hypothetical protein
MSIQRAPEGELKMGGTRTDHHPFAAVDTPSFHDLLDRVIADEQLDPRRQADVRSAIKSLGQWLGLDLTAMSAQPRYLRERLAGFQPGAAGVSRKRLQNVHRAIAFALDRYGLGGRRSYLAPLSPAAQALYNRLPDKYFRCRLSRLLHFISAQGFPVAQISRGGSPYQSIAQPTSSSRAPSSPGRRRRARSLATSSSAA